MSKVKYLSEFKYFILKISKHLKTYDQLLSKHKSFCPQTFLLVSLLFLFPRHIWIKAETVMREGVKAMTRSQSLPPTHILRG